jgi:preprotein translocase subunit SecD
MENAEDLDKIAGPNSTFLQAYDEYIVKRECPADATNALCLRVSSDYAERIKVSALDQAIETIRERINEKGIAEPSVIKKQDQIIVELPGLDQNEIKKVKDLIRRTAKLEFKIVDDGSDYMRDLFAFVREDNRAKELKITAESDRWRHDDTGKQFNDFFLIAEDEQRWLTKADAKVEGCYDKNKRERDGKVQCTITGKKIIERYVETLGKDDEKFKIDDEHQLAFELQSPSQPNSQEKPRWRTYYLHRPVELAGTAVLDARTTWNPTTNRPEVLINFNRWGGRRFGELTGANVGRKMAIILDDKVNSAPVIQTEISGGASTITMGQSDPRQAQEEATDLVNVLQTGSLPAPLQEETSSEVGPLLGSDAVSKAKFSFLIGSGLVLLLLLFYYRTSGIISIVALTLNLLFMMALLAGFGATLTLPGIAALVLTVGMAVDANIIIYERIREELRAGKSIRGAVDAGFSHALSAIIDGQLTTGLAAFVLYQYGSGPIRGFAVMLLLGIICNIFTATWCTRLFFEIYVGRGSKVKVIGI